MIFCCWFCSIRCVPLWHWASIFLFASTSTMIQFYLSLCVCLFVYMSKTLHNFIIVRVIRGHITRRYIAVFNQTYLSICYMDFSLMSRMRWFVIETNETYVEMQFMFDEKSRRKYGAYVSRFRWAFRLLLLHLQFVVFAKLIGRNFINTVYVTWWFWSDWNNINNNNNGIHPIFIFSRKYSVVRYTMVVL